MQRRHLGARCQIGVWQGAGQLQHIDQRQPSELGHVGGHRLHQLRVRGRGHGHHGHRPRAPAASPAAEHGHHAVQHRLRCRAVGRREQRPQGIGPARIVGEGQRAALAAGVDPAFSGAAGRPQLARLDDDVLPARVDPRRLDPRCARLRAGIRQPSRADAAAPAVAGCGVVQRLLQKAHQAALACGERAHQARLARTHLAQRLPALRIEGPGRAGQRPGRAFALHHLLDRQDLQQPFEPAAPDAGAVLQRQQALRPHRQRVEDLPHAARVGHAGRREVGPDALVRLGRQQHGHGIVQRPAGAAHLLVVGNRRGRRADVDAEGQVGLVVAHAQRRRGDHGLERIAAQRVLDLLARGRLQPAVVGRHREAAGLQEAGDALGVGHRQRVDDARAREGVQRIGHPGQALQRPQAGHHGQAQRGACQRAAEGQRLRPELARDVFGDAVVGGGRGGQHRCAGRDAQQRLRQALVVGAEIEAPVGDAVRLVDHHQPGAGQQIGQTPRETGVAQPLGRDQQHVQPVGGDVGEDAVPIVQVGGVDGGRTQAAARRCGHLVTHERQQRRDDQRGTLALRTQGRGGRPVHGRLAPAGGLHHEHAGALLDQRGHGGRLVFTGMRSRARHRGEDLAQVGVGEGHGAIVDGPWQRDNGIARATGCGWAMPVASVPERARGRRSRAAARRR